MSGINVRYCMIHTPTNHFVQHSTPFALYSIQFDINMHRASKYIARASCVLMPSESYVRNERVSLLLVLHTERNVDLAWTCIAQPPKGVPNFSV